MANKIMYNVGMLIIGGSQKNLFLGSADGVSFLTTRSGSDDSPVYTYHSRDYIMTQLAAGLGVVDNRLDLGNLDNAAEPAYTTLSNGVRTVAVTNSTAKLTEAYTGQPYYSIKGDGVADYAGGSVTTNTSTSSTTATTSTGFLDQIWAFVQANLALVLIAVAAFIWFDPFGWNLLGTKKKKRR